MALAALAQIRPAVNAAIQQYGPERIGVVVGTSTSGIANTEEAMRDFVREGHLPTEFRYASQEMGSPAGYDQ